MEDINKKAEDDELNKDEEEALENVDEQYAELPSSFPQSIKDLKTSVL